MTRRTTRTGEAPRAPLEQTVGLRFKQLGEFTDELAANVSTGGLFIRTRNPHPVGSVFEFELRGDRDRPLIAGKAQVAWVRRRAAGNGAPAGMGVRFVELDDKSRRQIAELVGGAEPGSAPAAPGADAPADPAAAVTAETTTAPPQPPAARPAPAATVPPPPMARAASAAEASSRRRPPGWLLAALIGAAVLAFALWLRPAAESPAPAGGAAAVEPPAAADPGAAPAPRLAEALPPPPVQAVESWARAWSEQRVDDYLDAYSPSFVPPWGLSRAAWERQRRARILAPQWIEVGLAFVELEPAGADRARVRFVQAYESDSYRDVVRKALELERRDDGWKIQRELVEP